MNKGDIKALLMTAGGFAMIAFGLAAAMAAKMADTNAWLNEVLAIGHLTFFVVIGSDIVRAGWRSLKSARSGTTQSANDNQRSTARRS